jgi:hypothetical protein
MKSEGQRIYVIVAYGERVEECGYPRLSLRELCWAHVYFFREHTLFYRMAFRC